MTDPRNKRFHLRADQLRPVATGRGSCYASDMITVEGRPVGFMYREAPDHKVDSGWRFMAGVESDEYINDAENVGIYDVNTIANYDPDIVPFLTAPIGSAFERDRTSREFVEVHDFTPPAD